jgi:hypothetical protein
VNFVHSDRDEFADLIRIVAAERGGLLRSIVEKDYWVTHTLWALSRSGLDIWFKGGTSLSKGFGLIERFSEDLDLKIEPGARVDLPRVTTWKSEGTKATEERKAYFEGLANLLNVPDCDVQLDQVTADKSWRGANIRVAYPSLYAQELPPALSPQILLEVGNARVTPYVECDVTSFVHELLTTRGAAAEFTANAPLGVRCVHPLVTLLEKLDALHRRFPNEKLAPASFVRHYEDAARLVEASTRLPVLVGYANVRALADEMLAQRQIVCVPRPDDPAFMAGRDERWDGVRSALNAIDGMFWGARIPVERACQVIQDWITSNLT